MGEKLKHWLPAIGVGLVLVLSMIPNIPNLPEILGISLSVWVIGILLVVQIIIDNKKIYDLEHTHSNVVSYISKYATLEDVVHDYRGKNNRIKYTTKRYYLPLRQVQKKGIQLADTESVNAEVSYFNTECKDLKELSQGFVFWYDDKPRVRIGNQQQENSHIIRKSGEIEGVCLAIKEVGSKDLYVFNHDSYFPGTGDFQFKESMKIKDKVVYAKVTISDGVFDDKTFWVRMTNFGNDKDPLFELVDKPC